MALDLSKLGSLFTKHTKSVTGNAVVGIDIGSSSIKIVELEEKRGVPTLTTYGELQLGPYEGVEIGRTTRLPGGRLAEACVDILREASAKAQSAALGISYNASFATIISVPTLDTEKITSMISVEARKYVPVSLSEVTLDWFPVSSRAEGNTTKILLAAIHNEALKRYEAAVSGAALNTKYKEIEIFSTIRSSMSQKDDTVAIIDLGAASTKLYIATKGVVGKTHSILLSGAELTNEIAKGLTIEFVRAEELKRVSGLLQSAEYPDMQKIVVATVERGLREIHRVISRYEEDEEVKIEKIILSGGGALLPGMQSFAKNMFMRPVTLSDPFAKVAYPAFLEDTLKEAGPSFAVAIGAALRALVD